MKANSPALILTFGLISACGGGKSSEPNVGHAQADNPVVGLWRIPQAVDEDLVIDEDDPVDFFAEYLEITEGSYILYVTDGISNCYEANIFPLQHITGEVYSLDFIPHGETEIHLEANESTLTINGNESYKVEFDRVVNISSQDFNSCTS